MEQLVTSRVQVKYLSPVNFPVFPLAHRAQVKSVTVPEANIYASQFANKVVELTLLILFVVSFTSQVNFEVTIIKLVTQSSELFEETLGLTLVYVSSVQRAATGK